MLNYMVDPEGNTYEIEATTYAGDRSFVDAAKTAARRYNYMTSHFNGEPMHSSAVNKATFRLFRKQVSATTEQINQTLATLADLDFTYLCEDVFFGCCKSAYAGRLVDRVRIERSLDRALRYLKGFKVFTAEKIQELQQQLL